MRKRCLLILLLLVTGVTVQPVFSEPNPFRADTTCAEPIAWRIGHVPAESELDRITFQRKVEAAAKLWNAAGQGTLLVHDPIGGFPVDLRVGEAQRQARQLIRLQDQLAEARQRLADQAEVVDEILAEQARFQDQQGEQAATYNEAVQKYNRQVREIGRRIARAERKALEDAQEVLASQRQELESLGDEFRQIGETVSLEIRQYNDLATRINELVGRIEDKLPDAPRDAGDYRELLRLSASGSVLDIQRQIRIHFWYHPTHLKTILAHEFGHALGLEHVPEPQAVMHASYVAGPQALPLRLHPADIASLNDICD